MKANRKLITMIFIAVLVLLSACKDSEEESKATENNESQEDRSTTNDNNEVSDEALEKTEDDEGKADLDSSNSDVEKNTASSDNLPDEMNDITRAEYLQKLHEMEEADRSIEGEEDISSLEEQENSRYRKWDDELNQIYDLVKGTLSETDSEKLRKEQLEWIEERDKSAKEASLKYEGGTTESLEYVATQASLTRERCYELVSTYLE